MSNCRAVVLAVILSIAASNALTQTKVDEEVCLGFSFSTWTPALDWRAAGHGLFPDTSKLQRSPTGRDWATNADDRDSSLMLFPAWWPVGVIVELPTRTPAQGDTVVGQAFALRANFDSVAPRSRVRAWRVPCRNR